MCNKQIPIVIIQGPTAVGKSSIAMQIAEKFSTDIISADSRQVYKYLNIGTAKPTKDEQNRVKHHLIDLVNPDINYSAGDFIIDANSKIDLLCKDDKLPIIVGGTGFYISALQNGLFQAPEITKDLRDRLSAEAVENGALSHYKKLSKIDPASANRMESTDTNRIIRALEIYETTGKTITQLWEENQPERNNLKPFNILITDQRQSIYDRINARVDKMLTEGLLDEISSLFKMGYKTNDPGMNTVGYRELFSYLFENDNLEDCVRKIKKNSRNFAKRQFTWYRKIDFDLTLEVEEISISNVVNKIKTFLGE